MADESPRWGKIDTPRRQSLCGKFYWGKGREKGGREDRDRGREKEKRQEKLCLPLHESRRKERSGVGGARLLKGPLLSIIAAIGPWAA